jgi:hypothetical protein
MVGHYQYTPTIWPMLVSAAIVATVGLLCWRRCLLPGALPAAVMMLLVLPWILGTVLELLAVELPAKVFWSSSPPSGFWRFRPPDFASRWTMPGWAAG